MVGAGGIGCELLKTLVLTGFKDIHLVGIADAPALLHVKCQALVRSEREGGLQNVILHP